jgi:Flp pilus assembly protein TadD
MRHSLMLHLTMSALVVSAVPVVAATPAHKLAAQAEKSIARKKLDKAIVQAEAAVAAEPRNAGYRMVLGRAYLESGRFRSAASSFAEALALDPSRSSAALSLVLAQLGAGNVEGARAVLATHGELIPVTDRGLALALAGDLGTAIPLLEAAVRDGGADAKTRQNLALSYALAGRWPEAKLMASYDLDPATLSARIMEWSRLARDGQAATQVSALLGVAPGEDAGMPAQLALSKPEPTADAPVQVAQVIAPPPPARMDEPAEAAVDTSVPQPVIETMVPQPAILTAEPGVQFAPLTPIVQPLATPVVQAAPAAAPQPVHRAPATKKIVAAAPRALSLPRPTGGRFAVQIGAFDSLGVAQASWDRSARRIGVLRDYAPSTATFVRGNAVFHRLSVSGFATRADAVRVCETLRARGAQCFVRQTAGDMPLQWVMRSGGSVRMAAR